MILETERLILRPWEESDAEECFKYAKDPEVGLPCGWPPHKSVEDSRRTIREVLSVPETYAIVLKETGLPVGSVGLHRDDLASKEDEAELGYWVGAPYWGQGIAPEAAREILRHAFEDLGLERVWCGYYAGNEKSKRVQEKLGFRHMYISTDAPVPQLGEYRMGYVSLMTREAWENMRRSGAAVVYVHGLGGGAYEAEHYDALFPGRVVTGFDYLAQRPWEAPDEFRAFFAGIREKYGRPVLIANSIGAYYSMISGVDEFTERAFFISPVTDMEAVIEGMMKGAGVTEDELREKGTVRTEDGTDLSWEYLRFVREHPPEWNVPTDILYGGRDTMMPEESVRAFAKAHDAGLMVMPDGGHWFHTAEETRFLDGWIREKMSSEAE